MCVDSELNWFEAKRWSRVVVGSVGSKSSRSRCKPCLFSRCVPGLAAGWLSPQDYSSVLANVVHLPSPLPHPGCPVTGQHSWPRPDGTPTFRWPCVSVNTPPVHSRIVCGRFPAARAEAGSWGRDHVPANLKLFTVLFFTENIGQALL